MSVTLHTVDDGTVNAVNDALFYEQLTNTACGLVTGGVVTVSSANTLHITSGWGLIQGRLFTIEAEDIDVEVSTSGTVAGRLKLVIDISDTSNPIYFESEAEETLSDLTQEDLNNGGYVYEFALATYDIDETNATDLVSNTQISILPMTSDDTNLLYYRGSNPITSTDDDTVSNWASLGNGIWYFNTSGVLNNQPATYGFLMNFVKGTTVNQVWFRVTGTTAIYTRAGNSTGWNADADDSGTWYTYYRMVSATSLPSTTDSNTLYLITE